MQNLSLHDKIDRVGTIVKGCANLSRILYKRDNIVSLGPGLYKISHMNILILHSIWDIICANYGFESTFLVVSRRSMFAQIFSFCDIF